MKNLVSTLLKLNNDDALSKTVKTLIELKRKNACNEEIAKKITETLVVVLTQYPKLSSDYDDILEQVLLYMIKDDTSINRHDYYKRYLKLLYRTEKFNELFIEAEKMHKIFNHDIYPLGNQEVFISIE